MASTLDELRAKNKDGKMDKLIKAFERTSGGKQGNYKEDDLYYPQTDADGNGAAIIRFLPGLESEDEPVFVETIKHMFKGKSGKFFHEGCPTFLQEGCPVCDANRMKVDANGGDFKALPDSIKKVIRNRSRVHQFYANIMVVDDKATPENNGKIFKFRFGKKIQAKIMQAASPEFETDTSVLVYDYREGANFRLIIKKVSGYANYDDSKFDAPSLMPDVLIDRAKKDQFVLLPYTDPKKYKQYSIIRNALIGAIGAQEVAPAPDADPTFNPDSGTDATTGNPPDASSSDSGEGGEGNPFDNIGEPENKAPENDVSEKDMDYFQKLAAGEE